MIFIFLRKKPKKTKADGFQEQGRSRRIAQNCRLFFFSNHGRINFKISGKVKLGKNFKVAGITDTYGLRVEESQGLADINLFFLPQLRIRVLFYLALTLIELLDLFS